jgi:S1-C subfamily serine protease
MRSSVHTPAVVMLLAVLALLSCALQGDYPAPALGVLIDYQLTVVDVLKGSAAERAGVQAGDVLIALNGTAYASVDDWRAKVSAIDTGKDYDLKIQRGGQAMTLRVTSAPYPPNDSPAGVTPTVIPTDIYVVRLLPEP